MAYKRASAGGRGGAYRRPQKKKRWPAALLIAADVLAAALLLLVFYLTNYVFHGETGPMESLPVPSWLESPAVSASSPGTPASADISAETSPTASVNPDDWRARFADKFTDGEPERTDTSYRSANISVTIEKVQQEKLTYYVADIYIADVQYFRTAFAQKADKMGYKAPTTTISQEVNAIIAINGDYALNNRDTGVVLRNGQPYHVNKPSADQLVLFYDGTMKAYSPGEFDYDAVVAAGAYQIWSWGPMLLDGGQAMSEFNMPDTIGGMNPRTAVGYYEPGHYCFVVVDGRQGSYSEGLRLPGLSQLFADLGCAEAYNLDGGQTSEMAFFGEFVNQPYNGGRSCSDILYIGE